MSGRKRAGKAQIHMSKPEPPAFLQRMKEQIVANEEAERQEQIVKKRKGRPAGHSEDPDDDPTVVKLTEGDLSKEEYERMKKDLETQYKLDDSAEQKAKDIDINDLFDEKKSIGNKTTSSKAPKSSNKSNKKLSFGTDEDDDDDD